MAEPLRALRTLGSKAAEGLEAFAPERASALERARENLLCEPPSERAPFAWWRTLGLAVAVTVALVSLIVRLRTEPLLSFDVDARAGRVSDQIAALRAPVLLFFSDGTRLTLQPSTRAHVVSLGQHGAQIALENGLLDASVIHTGTSAWGLSAGPFSVRVTGTQFSLSWDPDHGSFSIHVTQGSVGVSGAVVGAERPVRAGETLSVSVADQRLQLSNDQVSAPSAASITPPVSTPRAPAVAESSPILTPVEPSSRIVGPLGWRALALQGKLREAYASADAAGFEQARDSANAADLLLLGDAARLAGRPDRVNDTLLQLRRRFPKDPRSAAAAFMLGRVAFERGADRSAASWFSTSLREQPKGSLAREAAGRLIEALRRAGDVAGAERAAKDYLAWYPDGPHAALARSLLQ